MSRTNFTSETLRLEPNNTGTGSVCSSSKDSERTNNQHLQAAVLSAGQGFQKKKVSSFQITSIRPTSRSSNDGADDSENDTEDTSDILDSSRVTIDLDQETPSFSEEYSKSDDVLLGAGPVIPTSSQYGITALVQQTGAGGMMTARLPQGVTVNVTEGGLALAKADGEPDDLDNWQKRFKIVKIDSTEPFKRGRWICLDFMDSPALSSSENKSEAVPNLVVSNVVLADGGSNDSQEHSFVQIPLSLSSAVQYPSVVGQPVPNQYTGHSGQVPVPSSQVPPVQVQGGVHFAHSASQPMQVVTPCYTSSQSSQASVHSTSQGQGSSQVSSSSQPIVANRSNVHSSSEVQQSSAVSSTAALPVPVPVGIQSGLPTHSISSSHPQSSVPVTQQSEVPSQSQGISQSQNLQGGIINQGLQTQVIGISHNSTGIQQQQPPSSQPQGLPQAVSSTQQMPQNISPQQNQAGHQTQIQSTQQNSNGSAAQSVSCATQISTGSVSSVSSTMPAASYTSLPGTGATPTPATTPAQPQISIGTSQSSIQSDSIHQIQPPTGTSSAQHHPSTLEDIPVTGQGGEAGATSSSAVPPTGIAVSEEAESASTASTVAIDNKIEQAMDLVKSHLMFAVREEVDVLKERIVELMDRIKHLECENSVLRQYASPEVLQQLQTQMTHQQMQQPPHHSSTS